MDILCVILYLLMELTNYLLVYVVMFNAKVTKKKSRRMIGILIVTTLHAIVASRLSIDMTVSLSCISMLVIPAFLLEKREKKYFAVYPFIFIVTAMLGMVLSFIMAVILSVSEYYVINNLWLTLLCQCATTVMFVFVYICRKVKKCKLIEIKVGKYQYILFYAASISIFLMLAPLQSISGGNLSERNINFCGMAISTASIVFVIVIITQGIVSANEARLKEKNLMLEKYNELQEEYYRQLIEQDEKMRRFRHDMNAHFNMLKTLSRENSNAMLHTYLEKITEESALYDVKRYTGNKGVDAILAQFADESDKKNIEVDIKGNLPEYIGIDIYDMCTMLSNLLKNAIEACERTDEDGQRIIKVLISQYNSIIYLKVENSVREKVNIENNRLSTIKADKRNHGIGLENVERVVEKYDGKIAYSCDETWFTVEVQMFEK